MADTSTGDFPPDQIIFGKGVVVPKCALEILVALQEAFIIKRDDEAGTVTSPRTLTSRPRTRSTCKLAT